MTLLVKIHKKEDQTVVAVCDSGLIGHLYEEDGKQLDLRSDFYKGKERDKQEVGDIIRNADSVNLVGKDAVELGIEEDIIDEDQIVIIDGVPHAQAVNVID